MRIGRPEGMEKLKSYFENPENAQDSLMAKNLYDKISYDYYEVMTRPVSDKDALQNVLRFS